jgi:phage terminase small subunit
VTEVKAEKPLNAREERFVAEYMIDCNQTQAAIRAGFSVKSARQIASRLMTKANVQAAITRARDEWDKQYAGRIMQKYEVLARLTEIARGDIGDLLPDNANGEPSGDLQACQPC